MIKLFHFILPVRKIAAITILLSLLSFLLTLFPGEKLGAEDGPVGIVLGQTIWNAAQVGFLFILFQLFFSYQKWWFKFISILSIALLPFSVYLISPGGYIYLVLILLISVLVFILPPRNLEVNLLDSKILPKTSLYRFELLAFTCNLACSLYNYNSAKDCWPYWHRMFIKLGALLGLVFKPEEFSEKMFTLGLKEFNMPVFVPAGVGNNVGSVIFLLIWSILPFLYVAYFAILFQLSKRSYGTRIQQALCLFSIFHFLFLTDMVDYGFGRGIINPYAEWCHWTERLSWRIAILLPIYQKFMSREWKEGRGIIGILLHYGLLIWAFVFFIYQVLIFDLIRFYNYAFEVDVSDFYFDLRENYYQELGYHGALVLMTILYGFLLFYRSHNHFVLRPSLKT